MLLADADWPVIEQLRAEIGHSSATTLQVAAQRFCGVFADQFESVVLARMFVVVPFERLPAPDQAFARDLVAGDARLNARTPVLSLLGTRGREHAWNERARSRGHLAIPLLDSSFVQGAPMIAKLLADLEVDLQGLDDGRPVATRLMVGGRNGSFYVPDAASAVDHAGRTIIPAQDFVRRNEVRTVFGMGGAYLDGMLVIAIIFTQEELPRLTVERFPSFINNFKMGTAELAAAGSIFAG